MVIITTTTRRFTRMKIQFPAKASIHDSTYRRIYIRIPKSAWIAYQLERLIDKPIQVSIWKPGEEKPMLLFFTHLKPHRDTGRFVTTMWTDLEPTYYIVMIEEPE